MTKPLVFISYNSKMATTVQPVVDAVLANGYRVFVDSPENLAYSGNDTE